jgi:hypothetical protein
MVLPINYVTKIILSSLVNDGCTNHIAFSSDEMFFSNVLTEIAIAFFLSSNCIMVLLINNVTIIILSSLVRWLY